MNITNIRLIKVVPRVSVLFHKEADFLMERRRNMEVVYKKLNALMTPEALAQLGEAKLYLKVQIKIN